MTPHGRLMLSVLGGIGEIGCNYNVSGWTISMLAT
jgi:hypothetical protein